jgi:hypothetical protein
MIAFTDAQLKMLIAGAQPIPPRNRGLFLESVADSGKWESLGRPIFAAAATAWQPFLAKPGRLARRLRAATCALICG